MKLNIRINLTLKITSVTNVEDAPKSTQLLAATTLRNVLGTRTLQEILADRESIAHSMQVRCFFVMQDIDLFT